MITGLCTRARHRRAWGVVAPALLALVLCAAALAEAGAGNIPCTRPFVFSAAAVNVVVLPYESAPQLGASGGLGEQLAGLMQLEVLRSIAKYGSVGAVQMVGTANDCQPDLVIAKLLGQSRGAAATVRKGHGLVVVWGRIYSDRGDVFVQTFSRILRSGIDDSFDLTVGGQQFSAQLSAHAFACAPRKVTVGDLRNFEEQFARSTIVRTTPDERASGTPLPARPIPYWISDTKEGWMRIDAREEGARGWIRLSGPRDSWSLVRWLPELTYVEGMVGYLRARIAAQQSTPVRDAWIEDATRALVEYERSLAPQPASAGGPAVASWRTTLAEAVQLQMRGILAVTKPQTTTEDRVAAMRLFDRAADVVPHDANARNLALVMRLSLALDSNQPGISPKQTADDLFQALGSDPGNARLLANLTSAYEALLGRSSTTTPVLTDDERRVVGERLTAIKQVRAAKPVRR
jgi:hypothetical protein